ncbi:MAG: hypothetical protein DRJ65_15840 [Acidobacteria bacterium]|nr:MAG: hypothetical protein DRJ65_15840 [Acidobacteriota bacterium]
MSESSLQIILGETQIGHYKLTGILGSGGMGRVYRAFDERLHRVVAVKVLKPERRLDAAAERRFLREARLLSKLNHPGICQVYDLVEHEGDQFLILEFVEGSSLKETAEAGLDQNKILHIISETAEALAAAHREQVIHRDLKPENIMVTPEGRAKVLDFGIARLADTPNPDSSSEEIATAFSPSDLPPGRETPMSQTQDWTVNAPAGLTRGEEACTIHTRHGMIVGTPAYMAPEQVLGIVPTTACDLYSLGIILQKILTGSSPYGEDLGTMELLIKVSEADLAPPVGLDPDTSALIADLTNRVPEDRPTAAQCATRLRWILGKPERRRRKRILVGLSLLAGLALVVAAGVTVTQRWQAQRQTRLAREFSQKASSIEWMMRAEHLAPPHNLQETKKLVEERINDLETQVSEIGGTSAAPGHAAIGRAWAGLGDHQKAQASLENAWNLGLRTPELSCALGLSLGNLFNRALNATYRIVDEGLRETAVEQARRDFRDPALVHLGECRGSVDMPSGYVDALIALYEGRLDDCEELINSITDIPSWFYGVDALESLLLVTRAKIEGQTNLDHEFSGLQAAQSPLERALEVGRSDPELHVRLCDIESDLIYNRAFGRHQPVAGDQFDKALRICRQATMIDADLPDGAAGIVGILSLKGLDSQYRGNDPTEDYLSARRAADEAVASFPDSYHVYWARGSLDLTEGWFMVSRGQDVTEIITQCISDFRMIQVLKPSLIQSGNSIGNCAYVGAVQAFWNGADTSRWVTEGMNALRPLLLESTGFIYPHTAAANLSFLQALWQRSHGEDALGSFDTAILSYRIVTTSDPSAVNVANFGNALVEKGRTILAVGDDPSSALDLAEPQLLRALKIDPNADLAIFSQGNSQRFRAELAIRRGEDPAPFFKAAFRFFDTGLDVSPQNMEGYTEAAEARLSEARWLIGEERNPNPVIKKSRDLAGETLKLNPTFSRAQRAIAEAHLVESLWSASQGRSPLKELQSAQNAILELLETKPGEADNYQVLAEIHLARARWLKEQAGEFQEDVEKGLLAVERSLEINSRSMAAARILTELEAVR